MADIEKTSLNQVVFGVKSVTASASQLTTLLPPQGHTFRGVLIKAPGAGDDTPNSASVYVGNGKVSADQTATGGFPLAPGESLSLPISDPTKIYVVATDTSQKVNWIMV